MYERAKAAVERRLGSELAAARRQHAALQEQAQQLRVRAAPVLVWRTPSVQSWQAAPSCAAWLPTPAPAPTPLLPTGLDGR